MIYGALWFDGDIKNLVPLPHVGSDKQLAIIAATQIGNQVSDDGVYLVFADDMYGLQTNPKFITDLD